MQRPAAGREGEFCWMAAGGKIGGVMYWKDVCKKGKDVGGWVFFDGGGWVVGLFFGILGT